MRRHYLLAAILTLAVVMPRSLLIQSAHTESWDDQYHLVRGMYFWVGHGFEGHFNLPPLGEAIVAIPLLLSGCAIDAPLNHPAYSEWNLAGREGVLYGQPLSPEVLLHRVAVWKSFLFVPGALLVFHWCVRLYGSGGGWLALMMLLVDPTMAAHVTPATTDMLAMFFTTAALYAQWRWSEQPTMKRLIPACLATAAAMLTHHLAILLPLMAMVFTILNQYLAIEASTRRIRPALNRVAGGAIITALFIWMLTGFDISRPRDHSRLLPARYEDRWDMIVDVINPNLDRRWPAGIYIASLVEASANAVNLAGSWVLGRRHVRGVWYYFPVIATYKVPIGIGLVLGLGILSTFWRHVAWEELGLLVPLGMYALLLAGMSVQPGFRYALTPYLLTMMFASRCVGVSGMVWRAVAWSGVALAAMHSILWHPNYLSYVNWPRDRVWLQIGDSNLDWGQSLKQIRQWIDANAAGRDDVYLVYEGNPSGFSQKYYLGDRVRDLPPGTLPRQGLLIISPMHISGVRRESETFAPLRVLNPDASIGDCMLVFDLANVQLPASQPDATNLR